MLVALETELNSCRGLKCIGAQVECGEYINANVGHLHSNYARLIQAYGISFAAYLVEYGSLRYPILCDAIISYWHRR